MAVSDIHEERRNVRRQMIRLAKKRQRPGSGSSVEFLRQRTARMNFPDLTAVLPVPWAVVGAAATRMYMPERATEDFDVMIAAADARAAREAMKNAGFGYANELGIGDSTWKSPVSFPIDILESAEPWCQAAIAEAQSNRDSQGSPVLPLAYLVLMKFQSSRLQDIGDITRILGQADPEALRAVRELFRRYLNEGDLEDLESLILLGQMEMR